jgi:hypothetical protein
MYSASVEESATVDCFFADQLTAPDPIVITKPDVDRRVSRHPAWSASLYAWKSSEDI